MIQEFRVSNFLSFRDETVLSFEPGGMGRRRKGRAGESDSLVYKVNAKTELLRLAVFYGANASGKSNMLKALAFLADFCKRKDSPINAPTGAIPFLLNSTSRNLPSKFSLRFFINGIRYWYTLSLDAQQVYSEALYVYKSTQPTAVFKRSKNELEFNPAENTLSSTAKEMLQLNCLPNLSFFASRAKVNIALHHIDKVKKYFEETFLDGQIDFETLYLAAEEFVASSDRAKEHLLRFLKEADFNISGVTSKREEAFIPGKPMPRVRTLFTHQVDTQGGKEEYQFSSQEQSLGTRRVFAMESYLYALEVTDRIALIDELDTSLHPNLVDFMLSKFARNADSYSQLIITTHYTGLLDNPDLRDDCFWITEKDRSGASSIRSVGKTKDMRVSSKEKGYRSGKLGGIPKIEIEQPSEGTDKEVTLLTLFD